MNNENVQLLQEIKNAIREESEKSYSKLDQRIRDVELKVVEFKEQQNNVNRIQEELKQLETKVTSINEWRWLVVGGSSVIAALSSFIISYVMNHVA